MALNQKYSVMDIETATLPFAAATLGSSPKSKNDDISPPARKGEVLAESFQYELDELRTVAWIFVAHDGGPIRTIITGRRKTETGRNTFVKSGSMGMPWESRSEEPVMRLCEVATPVHSYLAQPHRLEMAVSGHDRHLVYFPDAMIRVDRAFAEMLMKKGSKFDEAVRDFRPEHATGDLVTLIIEAKAAGDLRRFDPEYQAKLSLAKQVYSGLGWFFREVLDTRDLANTEVRSTVNDIYFCRYTKLTPVDVDVALNLSRAPRLTYRRLLDALGGGKAAAAKTAALHVRRVISINLARFPTMQAHVRPLRDDRRLLNGVI